MAGRFQGSQSPGASTGSGSPGCTVGASIIINGAVSYSQYSYYNSTIRVECVEICIYIYIHIRTYKYMFHLYLKTVLVIISDCTVYVSNRALVPVHRRCQKTTGRLDMGVVLHVRVGMLCYMPRHGSGKGPTGLQATSRAPLRAPSYVGYEKVAEYYHVGLY